MEGERRPRLCNVSSYLMCVLCGGHYVDATSIIECLHTFCRSCIVRHLETSRFCPMCDVQVHKTKPLLSIRQDHHLQRLVYKMVPGLFDKELSRLREFYKSVGKATTDIQKVMRDFSRDLRILDHFSPDENISVSLEYYESSREEENTSEGQKQEVQKRYLNCPAAFSIRYLKKFIRMKYGLKNDQRVDVYYQNQQIADTTTIMDVAYDYHWNRSGPMKFGFQILERHTVTVSNTNRVTICDGPSSSALEGSLMNADGFREIEIASSDQTLRLQDSKKRLRDKDSSDIPEECSPAKRVRCGGLDDETKKDITEDGNSSVHTGNTSDQEDTHNVKAAQDHVEEVNQSVSIGNNSDAEIPSKDCKSERNEATYLGEVQDTISEIIVEEDITEVEEAADCIEEDQVNSGVIQDIEEVVDDIEGEPSQDFILQDDQNIDISEDLEEDDDEDRLRICDPEEISEEKNGEETQEEEPVHNNSVEPEVQEEKSESFIEEEAEIVRKENKIRKKNKKGKHHHRHKRDYSPAPEATIVSDDNSNIMKLRLKVINTGNENIQGKNKNKLEDKTHRSSDGQSSPRQSLRNYMIAQEHDNNSIQSLSVSNNDDDSRNSQSTDDHDVRSVASSKEGQEEAVHSSKSNALLNGSETGKTKNRELTTKEKLLQMRQVRHKNITPPPPRPQVTTTISKVSAEEACRKPQKSPILLTSTSSSLTVSKVTAEEKMKMMTSNNFENNRPSLEIIMVNNPNTLPKISDSKLHENQYKQKNQSEEVSKCFPVVKLMKNNSLNSLMQKQNSLSLSKVKSSTDVVNRNVESLKKDNKDSSDRGRIGDESFGALDLSGKSTRSSGSSPASDGSNCPSPNQSALSMSQPLINRHLTASLSSPHRSSSNSPPVPKGAQHPASLWGESISKADNTSAKMQFQEVVMKRQAVNTQQKKPSPQRRVAMTLPTGSASPRASPTELKIPTPNVGLASKFINRPKEPATSLVNKLRLAGIDFNHKPIVALTRPISRGSSGRYIPGTAFPNMLQTQSVAVAKKQAGINGRNVSIPPPPPAIPISTLYKLESMAKKYDMEKMARGLSKASKLAAKASKPAASIPSS